MISYPVFSDLTSAIAVESSLQQHTKPDPFGVELSGLLADSFIFGERVTYNKPEASADKPLPALVAALHSRDSDAIIIKPIPTANLPLPRDGNFDFGQSIDDVVRWMTRHNTTAGIQNAKIAENWVTFNKVGPTHSEHLTRLGTDKALLGQLIMDNAAELIEAAAARTRFDVEDFLFLYDTILRGHRYMEDGPKDADLLMHPLRVSIPQPFVKHEQIEDVGPPHIFGAGITRMVKEGRLSLADYSILLHELRGFAKEQDWLGMPAEERAKAIDDVMERQDFPMQLNPSLKALFVSQVSDEINKGTAALVATAASSVIGTGFDAAVGVLSGVIRVPMAILWPTHVGNAARNIAAKVPVSGLLPKPLKSGSKRLMRRAKVITYIKG